MSSTRLNQSCNVNYLWTSNYEYLYQNFHTIFKDIDSQNNNGIESFIPKEVSLILLALSYLRSIGQSTIVKTNDG